jgi:putative intracellular protease/amidase
MISIFATIPVVAAIYEQGGIAAAVCHGPAAHLNATLSNDTFKPL